MKNSLDISGSELLAKPNGLNPSHSKEIFTKPKAHGGSAGRVRKPEAEPEPEEMIPEQTKPEGPKPKPVKITNGKWDKDETNGGETAVASVDIDIPEDQSHLTRVLFTLHESPAGGKPEKRTTQEAHAQDGKAHCEFTLPEPVKKEDGTTAKKNFHFTAKHANSEETHGAHHTVVPGKGDKLDCVLYYSPKRGQYLHFETEAQYETLWEEIGNLKPLHGKLIKSLEAKDPAERKKLSGEIAKEMQECFEGDEVIEKHDILEELVLIRKHPLWKKEPPKWVYVRPDPKKKKPKFMDRWKKKDDAEIKKNVEDLLKKPKHGKVVSELLKTEGKIKLFGGDPFEKKVALWEYEPEKEDPKSEKRFKFSKEAAVGRFVAGWEGMEGSFDAGEKKIHLGTGGKVEAAIFDGKVTGEYALPEKGFNLITAIKMTTPLAPVLLKERQCMLRLNVKMTGTMFYGLSLEGALNLPNINLSKEKLAGPEQKEGGHADNAHQEDGHTVEAPHDDGHGKPKHGKGPSAEAGLETKGFVGLKVGAGLDVAAEWAPDLKSKFEELAKCGVGGDGSVGLGGEVEFKLEYKDGKIIFVCGASVTAGLGCKGQVSYELSAKEGYKIIGHLLSCVDFHYIGEVGAEAFKAYSNYYFTLMTEGEHALVREMEVAGELVTDFGSWLQRQAHKLDDIKNSLSASSYHGAILARVPPEALGQALITIMQTREPDDFRSILWMLNSTLRRGANVKTDPSANHKLKWTLRAVSGMATSDVKTPEKDAQKDEALRLGIEKIRRFGVGIGYLEKNGDKQKPNKVFQQQFEALLTSNGVI